MRRTNRPARSAVLVAAVVGTLTAPMGWCATPAAVTVPGTDLLGQLSQRVQSSFHDVNAYWAHEFMVLGGRYPAPSLTLFTGGIGNACSLPQATGSFYCPANETVYIDRAFVRDALMRTTGSDDVALALIVAHEIAHHVQNLLGTTALVEQARSRSTPALSTRTWTAEELQADCYAGLAMASALASGRIRLGADPSMLLEGIAAVSRESEAHLGARRSMPDPILTYGTAEQRSRWFERGLHGKGLSECDTFGAETAGKL